MSEAVSKEQETKWDIQYKIRHDHVWKPFCTGITNSDMLTKRLVEVANDHQSRIKFDYRVIKRQVETVTSSLVIE